MELTAEAQDASIGSPLLSLKMSGLAQIARSLDIIKSSKISEIVQSFRLTEMPHDRQKLEAFVKATPRS